jgi:DNA (cytosine-5)-methyltransferase 1
MQLSILEQFTTKPILKKRVRVFEAFAGYGSQSLALDWLNIDYEPVGYAEIDQYAIKAHIALHGDVKNYGDVTKLSVADLPDMDLFTYSFPCQDISVAGKQNGLAKDSGTRSSLLWECERIIEGKRPKYLMMENVKNLVGVENYPHFMAFVQLLEGFGYNNYWQVINAKECGIPQNRERVFCVSIRQDVDDGSFYFEKPFDNGLRLKDLLESEVDEKYYIDEEKVQRLISQLKGGLPGHNPQNEYQISSALASREHRNSGWKDISPTLCARDYKDPKVVAIPCITPDRVEKRQNGRRFKEDGDPMFTLTGQDRHGVLVREATKQGYAIAHEGDSINLEHPDSKTRRGRVGKGVAQTLTTSCNQAVVEPKYRIRRLTVTEVFRLMGLNNDQIIKIQSADISNSQQYKMAGNSIVVQQMAFLKNLPGIKFRGDS